jgi:two-component system C4-dicarboxylate transport sensor histidine kinase DctB
MLRGWATFVVVSALLVTAVVVFAGDVAEQRATTELARTAQASAMLHAAVLRSELAKHRSLPFVIAHDSDVIATLRDPTPAHIGALNRKLETLGSGTGAAVIYLLNDNGLTIAASNWRLPGSFVGADYSFRPYFKDAKRAGIAEMFALGASSHRPGLYMSHRIDGPDGALGVVVVKAEFEQLEKDWSAAYPAFAVDRDGAIVVTSVTPWRFLTLRPLPAEVRARLKAEQRFGPARFPVLKTDPALVPGAPPGIVSVALPGAARTRFMAGNAELGVDDWTVFTLAPVANSIFAAVAGARAIALLVGLVLCGIAAAVLRWRSEASIRAARQASINAELELRVQERTAKLRNTNQRLTQEMEERRRAEAHIMLMQDELVQSNKLAILGQIAAGVAHEINQPLAAIRSYADNAGVFLDRDEVDQVQKNLTVIAGLTDRIGVITDELRTFARKSNAPAAPVVLSEAICGALLLLAARIRQQGVTIERCEADEDVKVMAERFRLEQVLVNLIQNALEAMDGMGSPRIAIAVSSVKVSGREKVRVAVSDNGPGLAPHAAHSLFTPFATTKTRGLGLGLVISRDIVSEFGGDLSLKPARAEDGTSGASFVITLPKAR